LKKLAVLLAVAALAAGWALLSPYRGFEGDAYVDIPRGTGTAGIAQALADGGVIRYPWQFWVMRATRPSAKLQAGEYRFARAASVLEVFDRIARGDIFYFEFTVPEGSNIFDIARALEGQHVMTAEDFLTAATDASSIRDLAPKARTLEGYLFPSTYRLSHHTTPAQLCKRMTDEFRKEWSRVAAGQTAEVNRTVTLASLVEKETGVAEERPLVASVFTNRLEKGMRLECDPTTIYAALLDNRYRGAIHRSDLASANPYNTYQNAGLPPGPIANPGAQAIQAALHPAQSDYLYFVAKPSGDGHHFSASMAEHEKAVEAYRHASHKRKTN
jgi:peptidoglycan lytic transglycosylase G